MITKIDPTITASADVVTFHFGEGTPSVQTLIAPIAVARAWRLAHAHSHAWATVGCSLDTLTYGRAIRALQRVSYGDGNAALAVAQAGLACARAIFDSSPIDRHVMPRTAEEAVLLNLVAAEPSTIGGIGYMPDTDGTVSHMTITGRCSWAVRADGSVRISIWRPRTLDGTRAAIQRAADLEAALRAGIASLGVLADDVCTPAEIYMEARYGEILLGHECRLETVAEVMRSLLPGWTVDLGWTLDREHDVREHYLSARYTAHDAGVEVLTCTIDVDGAVSVSETELACARHDDALMRCLLALEVAPGDYAARVQVRAETEAASAV